MIHCRGLYSQVSFPNRSRAMPSMVIRRGWWWRTSLPVGFCRDSNRCLAALKFLPWLNQHILHALKVVLGAPEAHASKTHRHPLLALTSWANRFAKYGRNCSNCAGELLLVTYRFMTCWRWQSAFVHRDAILARRHQMGTGDNDDGILVLEGLVINMIQTLLFIYFLETVLRLAWAVSFDLTLRLVNVSWRNSAATSSWVDGKS